MRRLCIAIAGITVIVGSVLYGRFLCEDIQLDNGLWWAGLALVAGLLLVLDWLGGEDD